LNLDTTDQKLQGE